MRAQIVLTFGGRSGEALKFYTRAVGAEVSALMRWQDSSDSELCWAAREVRKTSCAPRFALEKKS